jgi:hypothetical protein
VVVCAKIKSLLKPANATPDFWNPLKTAPLAARWGVRFIQRQYDLLSKLIIGDVVLVANPAVFAAALVHEKSGTPWVNLVRNIGISYRTRFRRLSFTARSLRFKNLFRNAPP